MTTECKVSALSDTNVLAFLSASDKVPYLGTAKNVNGRKSAENRTVRFHSEGVTESFDYHPDNLIRAEELKEQAATLGLDDAVVATTYCHQNPVAYRNTAVKLHSDSRNQDLQQASCRQAILS